MPKLVRSAIEKLGEKNTKKRAVVAVARKLTNLLYGLWCTGEIYEPLRSSGPREERAVAQVA